MIQGITISLKVKTASSENSFGEPTYTEEWISVDNVLVGEPSSEDIQNDLNQYGKRLAYTLAIPKGDSNVWTDTEVTFFGETFRTYGDVTQGIENNIPLKWNKKVKVERYGN